MNPVKIGLLGLGTVGGGTVTVLTRNAGEIARRAGRGIRIAHAAARQYDPERASAAWIRSAASPTTPSPWSTTPTSTSSSS